MKTYKPQQIYNILQNRKCNYVEWTNQGYTGIIHWKNGEEERFKLR
jgi:hypothetical protein